MRRRSNITSTFDLYARQHRGLTEPEQALWAQIRGGRLGVWFRRQVVIGRYIGDFVVGRERLVVEVDGGYHATRASADARRHRKLLRLGYRVLRLDVELIAVMCTRRSSRSAPRSAASGSGL